MPKHRKQDVEARIELLAGTPAPFEDSRRVVVLKNSARHCTLRATRPWFISLSRTASARSCFRRSRGTARQVRHHRSEHRRRGPAPPALRYPLGHNA